MKITIREETESDYRQITIVHTLAFKRDAEARLVENLRKTPKYVPQLSLVAEHENEIIGHVLFYPIQIKTNGQQCNFLGLAPVSVVPSFQNRKVGTRLIKTGLETAKKLGFKSILVVGHSTYYPRFGFEKASKYGISASFKIPDNAFFAIELERNAPKNCRGTMEYPKEFNEFI